MSAPTLPIETTTVRRVSSADLLSFLPPLVRLFVDAVNDDTGLGFVAPITEEASLNYWLSLRRELDAGTRVLLVASIGERIVGSGQLAFATTPNARHRAEVQKVFVDCGLRGRGIGRALMTALHEAARDSERTLITLSTRLGGGGHQLYLSMGYREIGVIPRHALTAGGMRADAMFLYHELAV